MNTGPSSRGALQPGDRFRDYLVLGEIARGGQGVVLSARHSTGAPVALKLLLAPDPRALKRFKQEARVLARLDHPHLLRLYEHGEEAGVPFLAVEHVAGRDLRALVQGSRVPPFDWTARNLATVAYTLGYCHERGLIHRDMKPANVLIEDGSGRPVVIDFGLVKRDADAMHLASLDGGSLMSKSGSLKGTPEFMAPEQVNPKVFGEVTAQTDVYGLGATLYYLLTRQPPFRGRAAVVVMRKVTRKPPAQPVALNPQVPPALAALCMQCLEKDPSARPDGAAAFAVALARAGGVTVTPPALRSPSADRPAAQSSSSGRLQALSASSAGSRVTGSSGSLLLPSKLPGPGEAFAGCTIERELARGGAGAVFVAQRPDGSRCAIKILLGDLTQDTRRERFLREAQVGRELTHPGVVQILGRGEDRGLAFLVMELVEGGLPLDQFVEEHAVSVVGRVNLILQVAQALEAAHDMELIHRDLKPDNVLVTPAGEVKVLDFGLARHLDKERLTLSGAVMGTVSYMAPEQVMGRAHEATPATDVWAMGVMLYELVRGELPFEGSTNLEVMAAIMEDSPADPCRDLADAPPGLSEVIRLALAKKPKDRYRGAATFGRDLVAASSGSGSVSAIARLQAGRRERLLVRALVAVAVGLAVCLPVLYLVMKPRALSEEEVLDRLGALAASTQALLDDAAPLSEAGARLGGLEVEVADLQAKTSGAAREEVARAASRLRALRGLVALANADLDTGQEALASVEGGESVEVAALAGAVAAVRSDGDAGEAARLLGRALRKLNRPELRSWRTGARVRAGLTSVDGEEVLSDLKAIERARPLRAAERCRRVLALLATERRGEASDALAGLTDAPPALRWAVCLAKVGHAGGLIETKPAVADRQVAALPSLRPLPAQAEVVGRRARQLALALLRADPGLSSANQLRLAAWIRLCTRLLGGIDEELVSAVTPMLAGFEVSELKPEFVVLSLAIASSRPDDVEVQTMIGMLIRRGTHTAKKAMQLLPALRRAISLETRAKARRELELNLCLELGAQVEFIPAVASECVVLASKLLPRVDDPEARARIHFARGRALTEQGDLEGALPDLRRAIELHSDAEFQFRLAQVLRGLDRDLPQAMRAAAASCLLRAEGSGRSEVSMAITWTLALKIKDMTYAKRAIAHVLSFSPYLGGWWTRLGLLQLESGDRDDALKSLRNGATWLRRGRDRGGQNFYQRGAGPAPDFSRFAPDVERAADALERDATDALEVLRELVKKLEVVRLKGDGVHP